MNRKTKVITLIWAMVACAIIVCYCMPVSPEKRKLLPMLTYVLVMIGGYATLFRQRARCFGDNG